MDYQQELNQKLAAARKRLRQGRQIRALKSAAPSLFEIIDGEISLELNRGYGDVPLSYEAYLESHGAVRGIRRLRNLMDARTIEEESASNEVKVIQDQLKQFDNDKQQKQQ